MAGYKIKSNVIAVLLNGCESWRMTKGDEAKLDTFQHKFPRRLLKIYLPMQVSDEEVHKRANMETISKQEEDGHGLSLYCKWTTVPSHELQWRGHWKESARGRSRETWRKTEEKELKVMGYPSWAETQLAMASRVAWRSKMSGHSSPRVEMEMTMVLTSTKNAIIACQSSNSNSNSSNSEL